MPDMSLNLTALRGAHKAKYYVTPLLGNLVYSATVSSATTTAIAITGGSGTIGDVGRGFRVVILSSGGDYKGTVSVRYSGSITTASIPIRETSAGTVSIVAGDLVRIYNMLVLADKLVEAAADFNPDGVAVSTETSAQRPRVCSGGWDVGRLSGGSYIVYLKGASSGVVDSTSSTITHLWETTGGSLSSSSAAEPLLTISAAGYYLVKHTVTDTNNSQIQVQYVPIYVHSDADPPYECLLTSVDGDPASGFRATFELFESATIDDLPDGCAVIVWAEDTLNGVGRAYGAAVDERSHIVMSGFLRRDTSRARGDTGLETVEFEVISPLAKLGELPGFSKVMVNDASPDAWAKTYDLGVFRAIMQLLTHYTNALNLFDLTFTLFSDYDYPALYLQKSTPLDQVKELADAVDCRFVCDRGGHFEIQRRLELLPLADRSVPVTTITLTTQDIIDYECTREHYRPVETYRARGILQGHMNNTPLFARWPATPNTGNQSPVIDKLIAESAADLQERCALRGAYEDRVYFDADNLYRHAPTLRVTLFGAYARIFQFYAEWIAFSGITTLRGVDLSDFRWILQSVSESYDGGTATTTVTLQAETAADGATSVDDTPATESTPITSSPPVTYTPILTTSPSVDNDGLIATTDTLAVFDSGGNSVHIVSNFRSVLTGGTPTSVEHNLSLTGTLASFCFKAGTSVNGYLATTSEVRTISDVFGARTLGTAYSYATGAVANARQVQLQSERGNPEAVLVAAYYDSAGTKVYYSTNGGSSFSAGTGLPSAYDNNLPNNAEMWMPGLWVAPDGSGNVLVSAATAVANPPGADFYSSSDNGATLSVVATSGWDAGGFPAGAIAKPLNGSATYHGYIEANSTSALPGCGAGTYTWDYTSSAYDAYDNGSGSTWTTGEGWVKSSVAAGAYNYIIQPCDFSSLTSISVRLTVSGNVSLNFGIGSVPRRVDNTGNDSSVDYTYLVSGSASNVQVWLQMGASTTCKIERITVVGTRSNCPTNDPINKYKRIVGTTQTDITPVYELEQYGVPFGTIAQRAISVADDDANAVCVVGYNTSTGYYGVFQSFNRGDTWNVVVTPGAISYRGAYYVNRTTIYLYGVSGALGIALYSGGVWTVYSTTISGCGDIVGLCGNG